MNLRLKLRLFNCGRAISDNRAYDCRDQHHMSHTHGQTKTQSLKNVNLKDEGTAYALKIAIALHGSGDHIKWQSRLRHVIN